MLFPQYYFFAERRLLNHTIRTVLTKDLDQCEFFCYLNDDCVSLNIKKDRDSGTHVCELNNSTHQEHDADLIFDSVFYYRGSKVIRELKQRRRRRLGKRRLKTELAFLFQISRMAGCIQAA